MPWINNFIQKRVQETSKSLETYVTELGTNCKLRWLAGIYRAEGSLLNCGIKKTEFHFFSIARIAGAKVKFHCFLLPFYPRVTQLLSRDFQMMKDREEFGLNT